MKKQNETKEKKSVQIWIPDKKSYILVSIKSFQEQRTLNLCYSMIIVQETEWRNCQTFQSLLPISHWSLSRFRWRRSPLSTSSMSCLLNLLLGHAASWNGIMSRWPSELMTPSKVSLKTDTWTGELCLGWHISILVLCVTARSLFLKVLFCASLPYPGGFKTSCCSITTFI